MDEDRLTIERLQDETGVTVRTLRSWTQQGLLPKPGAGRYASYPADTTETVRRIKGLKATGASLDEIRERLAPPSVAPGGAAEYLAGLRRAGVFGNPKPPPAANGPMTTESGAVIHVRHHVRVDVTPTVHLMADGPLSDPEIELLRRAAGAAHAVLTRKP